MTLYLLFARAAHQKSRLLKKINHFFSTQRVWSYYGVREVIEERELTL